MSTKKASSQSDSGSTRTGRAGEIRLDASTLHHAYGLVGDHTVVAPKLLDALARDLALPMGNSDLLLLDYESLTIDEARNIKQYASTRPNGERRAIIISARGMTREAQNALLKSFEDPGEGVHFFLMIPSAHILLPTLRSRLSFIDTDGLGAISSEDAVKTDVTSAAQFIAMSYKDRLEWIKELADDIKDGKRPKQQAIDMLKGLQREASKRFPIATGNAAYVAVQDELLMALSYANDTSASLKMLLEHGALLIPID